MALKGASVEHEGRRRADRWALDEELAAVARRWGIDPARDLADGRRLGAELHRPAAPALVAAPQRGRERAAQRASSATTSPRRRTLASSSSGVGPCVMIATAPPRVAA